MKDTLSKSRSQLVFYQCIIFVLGMGNVVFILYAGTESTLIHILYGWSLKKRKY